MEDMLQLPLTKDKMARKLHLNIQKSKDLTLIQFLKGLGISGAGTTTWEKIVDIYPDLNLVRKITVEELVSIDGFAEKSSLQIVQGLKDKSPLIDQLLAAGVAPKTVVQTQNTGLKSLAGMLFVITGSLSRPRSEIEKDIKSAGGKVTGSVSTKTTAVITNDTDSSSSKMKKAIELNIPVWSETILLEKINL